MTVHTVKERGTVIDVLCGSDVFGVEFLCKYV